MCMSSGIKCFDASKMMSDDVTIEHEMFNINIMFISAQFSDWQGVGQNVARDIAPGTRGQFNVTNLVGHWFRQIRLWDPAGVEAFG